MAAASDPAPTVSSTLGADERTGDTELTKADSRVWDTGSFTSSSMGPIPAVHCEEARSGRILARRYRLIERLGGGAHGEVWTADDRVLRELVAVKWMRRAAGRFQARIRREITTLRMLREPGVVRLLDDGVEDGLPFVVMERIEGKPFPGDTPPSSDARPRWTWDAIAEPAVLLLEVLSCVHAAGVIHRDLKPDNVLVNAAGQPTVLDFGISVGLDSTDRLTDVGQVMEELLRWLALGGRHLELDQLAQAMGRPVWQVEAECDALLACGAARRVQEHLLPRCHVDLSWPTDKREEVHRAIAHALRPGQEGRLFHLLAAEEAMAAAVEAVEVARQRARDGDLGAATTALVEGLRAVRHQGEANPGAAGAARGILSMWVKVAFADGTPRALDRVLYEPSRARRGPEVERLGALVRAGISARGASGEQALELVDSIGPFEDPELERWRQRGRVLFASTRPSPALLAQVLEGMSAWPEPTDAPVTHLSRIEGKAVLHYAEGRFDEAAALHAAAAAREPWITGRIDATVRCGAALLEAFRHREAAERAATAKELAAGCRHVYWEGRAEWLLRAARYRMGEVQEPDLELVDAVERVGVPVLEALVCVNEAAVAFRAGAAATAAALAQRAAEVWKGLDQPWGALLSRCLSLACGEVALGGEVAALAERAMQCPVPGIGVQALGLLGWACPEARCLWRHAVGALAEGVPRAHWGERVDVLSVDEALEAALGKELERSA